LQDFSFWKVFFFEKESSFFSTEYKIFNLKKSSKLSNWSKESLERYEEDFISYLFQSSEFKALKIWAIVRINPENLEKVFEK